MWGTPSQTIAAISGSGADADINHNFASITDEVNKVITDIGTIETVVEAWTI